MVVMMRLLESKINGTKFENNIENNKQKPHSNCLRAGNAAKTIIMCIVICMYTNHTKQGC